MHHEPGVIAARSRRQAMDWSLVLLSQGIEAIIEGPSEEHGWQLRMDPADQARAEEIIRQYQAENRKPFWVQPLPGTSLLFDARVLAWCLVMAALFVLSQTPDSVLRAEGVMSSQAVHAGEWWRLFTATTLHGDVAHLVGNLTAGLVFVGLAMGAFGSGPALLTTYLAGACGNLVSMALHTGDHRSLGASGIVMGALGLLSAQWFALWWHGLSTKQLGLRALWAGCLLLIWFGFSPGSDVLAHVGGFAGGVAFGAGLAAVGPRFYRHPWVNRLAEVLFVIGVIIPWGWALAK